MNANPLSKLNALTIVSAEHQVHDYYMNVGPTFADPIARMLYAEIAHVEEQHVTHYESLIDPDETWLEKWLLHECNEVLRTGAVIDKLGERLAYERTGARLYEALLVKLEAAHVHEGGPTAAELTKIRDDEHRHMLLVRDSIRQLGADPTAMTPGADLTGVSSAGWGQVLADPRTTLTQCLDVMLIVERGDIAGWRLLIDLATQLRIDDVAEQFREADELEHEHASMIHAWLAAAVLGQLGVQPTPRRGVAEPR